MSHLSPPAVSAAMASTLCPVGMHQETVRHRSALVATIMDTIAKRERPEQDQQRSAEACSATGLRRLLVRSSALAGNSAELTSGHLWPGAGHTADGQSF